MKFHQPIQDRSLITNDIRGAQPRYLDQHLKNMTQAQQKEIIQNLSNFPRAGNQYLSPTMEGVQQISKRGVGIDKRDEFFLPRGNNYFLNGNKKTFDPSINQHQQRSEIFQTNAMQNPYSDFSSQAKEIHYNRNLDVNDIDGAKAGSLKPRSLINRQKAQEMNQNDRISSSNSKSYNNKVQQDSLQRLEQELKLKQLEYYRNQIMSQNEQSQQDQYQNNYPKDQKLQEQQQQLELLQRQRQSQVQQEDLVQQEQQQIEKRYKEALAEEERLKREQEKILQELETQQLKRQQEEEQQQQIGIQQKEQFMKNNSQGFFHPKQESVKQDQQPIQQLQVQQQMKKTPISQSAVYINNKIQPTNNNQAPQKSTGDSQFYIDINGFVNPNKKVRQNPSFFSFMGQQANRQFNILTNEVKHNPVQNVQQPDQEYQLKRSGSNFSQNQSAQAIQMNKLREADNFVMNAQKIDHLNDVKRYDLSYGNSHNFQQYFNPEQQNKISQRQVYQIPLAKRPYGAPYDVNTNDYKKPQAVGIFYQQQQNQPQQQNNQNNVTNEQGYENSNQQINTEENEQNNNRKNSQQIQQESEKPNLSQKQIQNDERTKELNKHMQNEMPWFGKANNYGDYRLDRGRFYQEIPVIRDQQNKEIYGVKALKNLSNVKIY